MSHEDTHLDWADESADTSESWADATEDEHPKTAWGSVPRNYDNADTVDPDLLREFPQVGEAQGQGRRSRNDAPRERGQDYGRERSRQDEGRDYDRERNYNERETREKYDDRRGGSDYGRERNYSRDRYTDRDGRDNRNREPRDYHDRDSRDYRDYRDKDNRDNRGYGRNYRDRDYDREAPERDRGDRDYPRRRDDRVREPTPFPEEAPWTAYVGNLSFQATEDEVTRFFEEAGCKVSTIRLLSDKDGRPKGFGYVEFQDADSLRGALQQNDMDFVGRAIRIDVAERRKEGRPSNSRFAAGAGGNWRTERPPSQPRRSPRSPQRDERDAPRRPIVAPSEVPAESSPPPSEEKPKKPKKAGANPFGDARPRDELEIQKQLQDLRTKQAEEARKQKEEAQAKRKQQEEENTKASAAGTADDKNWRTNKKEGRSTPKAGFSGSSQGPRAANGKISSAGGRRGGEGTTGARRPQQPSNTKRDGPAVRRGADDNQRASQPAGGTKSGDASSWKRGEGAPGAAKKESAPPAKKSSAKHAQSAPARPAGQKQTANSYAVLAEEDA